MICYLCIIVLLIFMSTLYLEAFLNLFVTCNRFLGESLRFSIYEIFSSANRDHLTFSWTAAVSFSCQISLAEALRLS